MSTRTFMLKRTTQTAAVVLLALAAVSCGATDTPVGTPPSAAVSATASNPAPSTATVSPTTAASGTTLAYSGANGKTALTLLAEKTNGQYSSSGEGANAFVTSINGVAADDAKKQYWALYVNGSLAQVGAGSLETKASDKIEWKLETY